MEILKVDSYLISHYTPNFTIEEQVKTVKFILQIIDLFPIYIYMLCFDGCVNFYDEIKNEFVFIFILFYFFGFWFIIFYVCFLN